MILEDDAMLYVIVALIALLDLAVFTFLIRLLCNHYKDRVTSFRLWRIGVFYFMSIYALWQLVLQPALLYGWGWQFSGQMGSLLAFSIMSTFYMGIQSSFKKMPLWIGVLGTIWTAITIGSVSSLIIWWYS